MDNQTQREVRRGEIESRLLAIADELKKHIAPGMTAMMTARNGYVSLGIHDVKTYQDGIDLLRSWGVQTWRKTPWNDVPGGRTSMECQVGKICVTIYANTLPPSCRLETVTEKIPKAQTITTEEFIEVQRTRVICGHDSDCKAIVESLHDIPALAGMQKEGDAA